MQSDNPDEYRPTKSRLSILTVCTGLHGTPSPSRNRYVLLSVVISLVVLLSFISTGFWYINHKSGDRPFHIYLLTEDDEPLVAKIMDPSEAKIFLNEHLPNRESTSKVATESTSEITSEGSTCSSVVDLEKFDCYPGPSVTEEQCLSKGCCYQEVSQPQHPKRLSTNFPIPHCYFPPNYIGYSVGSVKQMDNELTAELTWNKPSGFPKDISKLKISVTGIDENTVRIKITDSESQRFVPPIAQTLEPKDVDNPNYEITLSGGILSINRKATGTSLFKANLQQMVYSDQFLQISTKLPTSYLYGLGERYEPFLKDMNWTTRALFNHDNFPMPYSNLYGTHAIYVAIEDNAQSHGVFLLNSNAMEIILQPTPALTYRTLGGIFDFFVFLGPSPNEVIQQYTNMIGRPFMPPYWSLGFHLCRWGYWTLNETIEVWNRTRNAEIPFDTQWNDIDYMDKYNDFTYSKANFSGLPEFVDMLHENNMHYVIILDPGVSGSEPPNTYPPYDDGIKADLFIKDSTGKTFVAKVWNEISTVFPDFTHPETERYWYNQFKNLYDVLKFDGAWIDMNEPDNMYNGTENGCPSNTLDYPPYVPLEIGLMFNLTVCMSAVHKTSTHYNEHSLHAYREAMATASALRKLREKRPFIISRATFAGQGFYSGHWSGDIDSTWEDMRYANIALLNFNIFGIPMMGSDICGFRSNTTLELCARWQAVGAFYPFSRNHNSIDTVDQDPAILGGQVLEATKNTLRTRYTLLPYLYTLFYKSHVYGTTVISSLAFEFPSDRKILAVEDQFMWGSALLIMPALYQGLTEINVYLPKATWYDYYTGKELQGGQEHILAAPIDSINLAVRGGYVIPQQYPGLTTVDSRENNFTLLVALNEDGNANGELYWDDGDSLDTYENGLYNLINFAVQKNSLVSDVVKSNYVTVMELDQIKIYGLPSSPKQVTINGTSTPFSIDQYMCLTVNFIETVSLLQNFRVEWK